MLQSNNLTRQLGINVPIVQAPMAGAATPELIAAVSNAGGLGSLAAGYLSPEKIRVLIRTIKKLTCKPFNVNLFVPNQAHATPTQIIKMTAILQKFATKVGVQLPNKIQPPYAPNFNEQLNVIIEEQVPIFSFTFGIPSKQQINLLKQNKIITIGTATNVLEAELLENNGIDIVVAQGSEAGGHRGTFATNDAEGLIGLMALVPQIVDKVKIPVIAAGGIMDERGIMAALILGAKAVQMGTAFLTCTEAAIHPEYKNSLLTTTAQSSVLTAAFTGKLARGINNIFIEQMQQYSQEYLDFPIQNVLTRPIRTAAEQMGAIDYLSMWAGQAAGLCQQVSACEFINLLEAKMSKQQTYRYHHMGIPTNEPKPNERYSSTFKMYVTPGHNPFRIQWHRYEEGCPLHPLIQTVPHVGFKVDSIDDAIIGQKIILEPYYPFEGFRVAMIEVEGAPVELIETNLSEEEIWADQHKGSVIYPEGLSDG